MESHFHKQSLVFEVLLALGVQQVCPHWIRIAN